MRLRKLCGAVGFLLAGLLPALSAGASVAPGSWTTSSIPNPGGSSKLLSVSCPSADFCALAGTTYFGYQMQTYLPVIETWNGHRWEVAVTPRVKGAQTGLVGVSCPSASFCVAVGERSHDGATSPLAEVWNGHRWSISPTPPASAGASLASVSCPSSKVCLAVGNQYGPVFGETWDGTTWKVVPSHGGLGALSGGVGGVSCPTTTFCAVAGGIASGAGVVAFWEDRVWTTTVVVNRSDITFASISCSSARFCVASGADDLGNVAERWNGSAWGMLQPVSFGAAMDYTLGTVSCRSATFCMAAGTYSGDSSSDGTVQAWNGHRWSVSVDLYGDDVDATALVGMSCPSVSFCMTVGNNGPATVGYRYGPGRS